MYLLPRRLSTASPLLLRRDVSLPVCAKIQHGSNNLTSNWTRSASGWTLQATSCLQQCNLHRTPLAPGLLQRLLYLPQPSQGAFATAAKARRRVTTQAGTEAVPFSQSQIDAHSLFKEWWTRTTPSLATPAILDVTSMFLPYWAFTADVSIPSLGVHKLATTGPQLQVYSGAAFPRAMLTHCKNELLYARPFSARMLDGDFKVEVEPFSLYEATAWSIARQQQLQHEIGINSIDGGSTRETPDAKFSNVESHRLLQPCHVVKYQYFGVEFRAFVNGHNGDVYGIQQTSVFGGLSVAALLERAMQLHIVAEFLTRMKLPKASIVFIAQMLAFIIRPLMKVMLWPPFLIGSLLTFGAFAATRSTAGIRAQQQTFSQWRETLRAETAAQAAMTDDWTFRPTGESAADKARDRAREAAEAAAWEERARAARAERARRAASGAGSSSSSSSSAAGAKTQQQQAKKAAPTGKLPPPVDPNDYYAVLQIPKTASEADVQKAFRIQLFKFHPDHQVDSGYDPAACSERTRLIIKAYGVLRDKARRTEYDVRSAPRRESGHH